VVGARIVVVVGCTVVAVVEVLDVDRTTLDVVLDDVDVGLGVKSRSVVDVVGVDVVEDSTEVDEEVVVSSASPTTSRKTEEAAKLYDSPVQVLPNGLSRP
jgi:uncharacterized metal-binding protein